MTSTVYWAVLATGYLTALSRGQSPIRCAGQLPGQVSTCFTKYGLHVNMPSGQQDINAVIRESQNMDPTIHCRNLTVYKSAIGCTFDVMRDCLNTVNMGGMLPNTQKFQQGMDVLCQRRNDFDNQCVKSYNPSILDCTQHEAAKLGEKLGREGRNLNTEDVICLSADVYYDCSKKYLQNCKNQTLAIYLDQLNTFQVPEACVDRPPGRAGRERGRETERERAGRERGRETEREGGGRAPPTAVLGGLAVIASLFLHLLPLH